MTKSSGLIFKTKVSVFGIVIVLLVCSGSVYIMDNVLAEGVDNVLSIFLILIGLIIVYFIQTIPSLVLYFYNDHFIVRYPFLRILKKYNDINFKYTSIDTIQYIFKLREPNHLVISLKNGESIKLWCRFRLFSNDKELLGQFLESRNIAFQYRRFTRFKKYNEKNWK